MEIDLVNQEPVIDIQGLWFSYPNETVLEDVSFQISGNDFVAIVGPNGGGKTTLLKLILGLCLPDKGSISVFGSHPQRVRKRIGYMPQHSNVDPNFPATVMDVALMGRLGCANKLFARTDKTATRQALEMVGMDSLVGRAFASLSGGQRQRVLIARALASEPELLLLDEPAANLDIGIEEELLGYLAKLSKQMTVVLVSHDLGFVSSFVRRVVCVNRRVVVHPVHDITGEVIREVYGSDIHMIRHDHLHNGTTE